MNAPALHGRRNGPATANRLPRARPITAAGVLWIQLPATAVLLLMGLVSFWLSVPATAFLRDATAIAGINPFNGLATKLGAMVWSATIGITLFAAMLCRHDRAWRGLFVHFGALTVLLLLDDVFRFHETWAPQLLPGVPALAVYAFYALALAYGLIRYWRMLRAFSGSLLCVAAACFAASLGCDVFLHADSAWVYWLEDGAKLLGIVNWCACFSVLAAAALGRDARGEQKGFKQWWR